MTRTPGEYVYHAGYLPRGLESVKRKGLIPSKHGYAGSGVYFAYEPDEGFYHVDAADATMFRVRWADLVDKFGVYPKNSDGIQRDDQEIIVPNTVPADMLEVEYFPGEWWDINSAAAADRGPPVNEAILVTDVPREEWLEDKIAYAKKRGRDSFGVPYMGSTTAYVRQPSHVVLPVSLLARIPGARGEQKNVRQEDLAAIMKIMKDTGKLPLTSSGEEYKPFVCVAWNGEPWVMEGNHRIMAADRLGWDTLPVELKYFDGGERIRSGLLYPGKIGLGEVENSRETDENPLVVVYDKDGELHTHANLSVANNIFRTSVKPNEVFKGPVKVKSGGSYGEVTFDLSKHHTSEAVAETGTTVVMNEEPIKLKSQDTGRAREFIDAVYARYPYTFQNNHVMSWGSGEEQEVAMFELVPSFGRPNAVEIKWIQAYPLRKGVGSRAMKELQGMAQEHGVALTLFPWDKGRVSQAKLMKFYRGHGFQPTVKGAKNMIWRPAVAEASLATMRDYFNQVDGSTNVNRAPARVGKNPAGIPQEIQNLINKMYHSGKISPQEYEILRKFQQQTKINVGVRVEKQDNVKEAFDQPYKLRWEKGDHGDVDAYTKLPDGNYLSIMFNKGFSQETKEEAWSVEFYRNNSQEVTGEGDQQRVFATVLSAIQTFIKKYKPNKVYFSASKEVEQGQNAESRASLYDRLVQRYARTWGFRAFRADTGNKVIYELSRINKEVDEARTNPDQNPKPESGFKELAAVAKTIADPQNWAVSMTAEPKLGINPQVGISEDTPKGIYFYPLNYALDKTRYGKLPWGNDYPYIQLFQYDRSGEMTKETQVDPAKLKQALRQYCSDEVIQSAIDEPEYDGTPYWFIYDCLSRLGKSDETNIVRWNKVLRDLGFTSVYDDGHGWIAYNEPTQGVVLDPRVIKQLKTITNKQKSKLVTPAVIEQAIFETMDMELASNRAWQKYDPDGSKLRAAAKEYAKKPEFKQWFGKPGTEEIFDKAASWGRYGARELSQEAWEWFKAQQAQPTESITEGSGNDIETIIQSFITSPVGQKYKKHDCKTVTRAFVAWAEQNKIPTQVVSLAPPSAEFIAKNPQFKGKSGQGDGHIMPIVNGNAIDFTVRQFGVSRPFNNPLVTPTSSLPAVYGKFGYFTDKPEWFLGGKSHWIGALNSIPSEIFNQNFGDELLEQGVVENFADGKKPGRKGLAKRMGVDCSKSVAELRRLAAASSGEKQRMAHWCANMKSGRNESFTPMQMAIMEGGHSLLDEGGWASTATQNTKITPAVIEEAVGILKEFETEFNQWQAEKGLDVEIKMGRPVGSGTYYKRDLAQDPEREYGDVDVMCYIHNRDGVGAARRTAEYAAAVEEFTQGHSKYSTSNGTNVIMDTSAGPVQVDLIYTYHEHANWARMLAPEYRVKGVINTSLVSSLAEVLNLSIGVQGVQVKTRAGRPVNFRQSKDTELATVSLDPENWGADIYAYYYELAHGAKPKIPGNLAKHGGLKDEQRISDIVLTIKALATDLEQAKLLGTGALDHVANKQDMMQQLARVLDSKLEKVINSSKFDKAATPAAVEKANKTKLMLAKYRNEITKLLLN